MFFRHLFGWILGLIGIIWLSVCVKTKKPIRTGSVSSRFGEMLRKFQSVIYTFFSRTPGGSIGQIESVLFNVVGFVPVH